MLPALGTPSAAGTPGLPSGEHLLGCESAQKTTTGFKRACSCRDQPLLGEPIHGRLHAPSRRSVTAPRRAVTRSSSTAATEAHGPALRRSNTPPRLPSAGGLAPRCRDRSSPFPAGGGHPRFSHRHPDPSCQERHREAAAPGVADSGPQLPPAPRRGAEGAALSTHQAGPSLLGHRCALCTVPLGQVPAGKTFHFCLATSFSPVPVPPPGSAGAPPPRRGPAAPPSPASLQHVLQLRSEEGLAPTGAVRSPGQLSATASLAVTERSTPRARLQGPELQLRRARGQPGRRDSPTASRGHRQRVPPGAGPPSRSPPAGRARRAHNSRPDSRASGLPGLQEERSRRERSPRCCDHPPSAGCRRGLARGPLGAHLQL